MGEDRVVCSCPACHCVVPKHSAFLKWGRYYCSKICTEKCTPEKCYCNHQACVLPEISEKEAVEHYHTG